MMTIADKLREIADDFPGHLRGATHWDGCGGCELDKIADELDDKAIIIKDFAENGGALNRMSVLRIAGEIGGPNPKHTQHIDSRE